MTVTSLKISRYHKAEHVDRPENGGVAKLKRKKKGFIINARKSSGLRFETQSP